MVLRKKIFKKKSIKKKITQKSILNKLINELSPYTWGCGIEHEMHLFHCPKNTSSPIDSSILFDGKSATERTMEAYKKGTLKMSDEEYTFMKSVPFEATGRRCNNQWVIKKVPFDMPEFITWEPFCNIRRDETNTLEGFTQKIIAGKDKFIEIISREPITKSIIEKNGDLVQYPTGMTRYLKCPKNGSTPNYTFLKKKNTKESVVYPEYVGSYHITFTLPFSDKTSDAQFIKMHQNFANQLQWLEPLMLSSYFSQDQFACGSKEERVRGSFRVMIIGWGNLAGTDIRLFDKGIGRYAKTETYWRKGFKLYESEKLKPCIPPSPSALAENAITTLSSDFRTFGSIDPTRPQHRESGLGMTKPNGIEFRIFDHFQDELFIRSLVELLGIVAENSRVTQTNDYVYENEYWIHAMHEIMKYGYKAIVSKEYVQLLNKMLGIEIKTPSLVAYDVFEDVVMKLYKKNYLGKWNVLFNKNILPKFIDYLHKDDDFIHAVNVPTINKMSYILSFMMKLNRKPLLLKSFNNLSKHLSSYHGKKLDFDDLKRIVVKYMGKIWEKETDDIAYFYNMFGYLFIDKYDIGTIRSVQIINTIPTYKNFNKEIIDMFNCNNKLNYYFFNSVNWVSFDKKIH